MSEINVGAISEALNNKVDLPTPAVPQDAVDYVIEMQLPTADNSYTWYRKYKSGWVEQGGRWVGSIKLGPYNVGTDDITLPIVMSDGNYYAVIKCNQNNDINAMTGYGTRTNTATTLRVNFKEFLNSTTTIERADWYVCGFSA